MPLIAKWIAPITKLGTKFKSNPIFPGQSEKQVIFNKKILLCSESKILIRSYIVS